MTVPPPPALTQDATAPTMTSAVRAEGAPATGTSPAHPAERAITAADVTAIIVNWNTEDLLDASLRSLRDHGGERADEMEIVVVDNGSSDGSLDLLAASWPDVTVIANEDNVGFCRANNQAIEVTTRPYLLLINADAMLQPGCLPALLDRMASDDRVGVVAPRLVYGDGRFQRWTAGAAPSLPSMANYLFFTDRFAERSAVFTGHYLGRDTSDAFAPDWVSSACMLVRRAMFDEVGAMSDEIFVYMDDVELCQRGRDGGWTVWYEPAGTCTHLMGQSTKRKTGAASPEAMRAFNRYFERRHGRRQTTVLRALQVGGFGLRVVAYRASGAARRDDGHRAAARAHLNHLKLSLERPTRSYESKESR